MDGNVFLPAEGIKVIAWKVDPDRDKCQHQNDDQSMPGFDPHGLPSSPVRITATLGQRRLYMGQRDNIGMRHALLFVCSCPVEAVVDDIRFDRWWDKVPDAAPFGNALPDIA